MQTLNQRHGGEKNVSHSVEKDSVVPVENVRIAVIIRGNEDQDSIQ